MDGSEGRVVRALQERGLTLACAESCTGGLFGARLTRIPGASDVFRGGVIAYANDAKVDALRVDRGLIARHGAVSREVARAMAIGARESFRADLAISITGFAGPDVPPGGELGRVFIALAHAGGAQVHDVHFASDREAVRAGAVDEALRYAEEFLNER